MLSSAALTPLWAGKSAWTVLDTDLGTAERLLECCALWRSDPQRPRMLHLVGFGLNAAAWPTDHPWAKFLARARAGDTVRFGLDEGHISITLCPGSIVDAIREHTFKADTIYLSGSAPAWETWVFNAVARHCRRDTHIIMEAALDWQHRGLQAAGFCSEGDGLYRYAPAWTPKIRGRFAGDSCLPVGNCAVIGAGIAGASVAWALALRGWQVSVYERGDLPAAGASGLPVGLVVPHISQDDSPRSRLSRTGVGLVRGFAQQHLVHGADWASTGVTEQRWNGEGQPLAPLWHPECAWIKPAQLVQAWLSHPHIRFIGNCHVSSLQQDTESWVLLDEAGMHRGRAQLVVLANAMGCVPLLAHLAKESVLHPELQASVATLHGMHGTLSMGTMEDVAHVDTSTWPPHPCNGDGSFLSGIPTAHGAIWAAGSSFEKDAERLKDISQQHAANAARLQHLLPDLGKQLQAVFAGTSMRHWSGSRCVSHDRFALVGPVDTSPLPTLWISAAMGSRGLSFAALCAELLVARLGAEPLPVSDRLARSLDVLRAVS